MTRRYVIQRDDLEHLLRGGTLRFSGGPPQAPVEICLEDIGYRAMLQIVNTAVADGHTKVQEVQEILT